MIDFFIKRPIFTGVCSIVFIVLGLISIPLLPVSFYPELAPPTITVTSNYTGASADVVESSVTTPMEQAINGVEGMKYIKSTSSNDGSSVITVTFNLGKDKDIAAVDVQNRVSSVQGVLPDEVKRTGYTISKQSNAIVSVYAFYSEDGEYDDIFISNYVDKYISDELKRIPGVGGIFIGGERRYAMRVWLDPAKLAARNLTPQDVINAVGEQNTQVAAGQLGQQPIRKDQQYQMSIKVLSRLSHPEEFENLIIKADDSGSLVKLKDVASIELGSQDYSSNIRFNTKPAVGVLVYQLADANALKVYTDLEEKMTELAKNFPSGLKYKVAFETTSVVSDSIKEVIFTLITAILLVVGVIFIFLQSWRTTIIPAITIPICLIGTFAFLKLMGYSINTLSMLGIVLATGLVVDDAIVVVENIQRNITEKGLSGFSAASIGIKEVTSAVIASSIVLAAVFLPVTAMPGTTGQLYKEFAFTIVFAVGISTFNALTLSPALSAILLKKEEKGDKAHHKFWAFIESIITQFTVHYSNLLRFVLNFKAIVVVVFIVFLIGTVFLVKIVPSGFVPDEDNGYFITIVQCPDGASLNYTINVMKQIEKVFQDMPEINNIFAISGFSFSGNDPNKGVLFTPLAPFNERKGKGKSAEELIAKANMGFSKITDAIVVAFPPPSINGIGSVGGFEFQIIDEGNHSLQELSGLGFQLMGAGNQAQELQGLFATFTASSPQLEVTILRDKAKRLGISLDKIFNTIQTYMGSTYINDFDYLNRVYRVYVQAKQNFRDNADDLNSFYVEDNQSNLVPMSSLIDTKRKFTAQTISHFNLFRSSEVSGSAKPGYSSGQAISAMENLAGKIFPQGFTYRWSGITLEQFDSGRVGIIIFCLGLLFVYLVLAAQYESFVDPFIIIFAVPLAIFGALLAQYLRGLENDIYCQIALVMLIGLACKNSILIVEFANQEMKKGLSSVEAIMNAARTRFRPIMMTSLSFILGVFPLVIATGAGAGARNALGNSVFGGMFLSTILSLFVVPVLYLLMKKQTLKKKDETNE